MVTACSWSKSILRVRNSAAAVAPRANILLLESIMSLQAAQKSVSIQDFVTQLRAFPGERL